MTIKSELCRAGRSVAETAMLDAMSNRPITAEQSPHQALHSIARYMDQKQHVWETAITYTDRLVLRSGDIDSDEIDIIWAEWKTRHEVEVPRPT